MNAKPRLVAIAIALLPFAAGPASAQEGTAADSAATAAIAPARDLPAALDRIEGMNEQLLTLQSDVDKLKKFKLSGYVQARWETAENKNDSVRVTGSPALITPANNERFYVRRGRLKLTYDAAPLSQAVVYFDGASSGSSINARLLEAHVTLFDPWTQLHQHGATLGQMNVPFGYELERSSSARELPERSRAENVLFPGERDRGLKIVSAWTPQLETVLGIFNGGGINDASFPTTDPTRAKDLLARARFAQGTVDVGLSVLDGEAVTPLTGADVLTERTRLGADVQLYYQLPVAGGGSLRGELYSGHELNPDSVRALTTAAASPSTGTVLRPGADAGHFATDFSGWYLMWVQNWGDRLQVAARYDTYDPNLDLDHDQFERWGVGLNYFHDGYTRVTVSYDVPRTERLVAGRWDDLDDNLWTVQVQLKY